MPKVPMWNACVNSAAKRTEVNIRARVAGKKHAVSPAAMRYPWL